MMASPPAIIAPAPSISLPSYVTATEGQIQSAIQVAKNAGFQNGSILTAVATALAETRGSLNPAAWNNPAINGGTEDSRGLWQINVQAHPQYAGQNLFDPATNASAAFQVSSGGTNWQPWSTFTNASGPHGLGSSYIDYVPAVVAVMADPFIQPEPLPGQLGAPDPNASSASTSGQSGIIAASTTAPTDNGLTHLLVTIALVILALVLLAGGIYLIGSSGGK